MRIDHLVYAVPDLAAAVDDIERQTGVRAAYGGQHVGRGTHNALLALGEETYLEVIAPDPDQPEPSGLRPFGVDAASEARLVAWALACDDIDDAIRRARAGGYDPGDAVAMQRSTSDGTLLQWRLTLNAAVGECLPFLIAWGDTPHPALTAPAGLALASFTVESPAAPAVADRLRALGADVPIRPAAESRLVAVLRGPHGLHELP